MRRLGRAVVALLLAVVVLGAPAHVRDAAEAAFSALLATGSAIADGEHPAPKPEQVVPGAARLSPSRRDALELLGFGSGGPVRQREAVSGDQRTALALLETMERVGNMARARASQYFELIEDPLLNLAVPVMISIIISIIKMPIIMLITEILNFFLMLLLAIPLALALYPGTDPSTIPGAEGVPGMKPSSPLAQSVQSVQSSTTSTTTTTTVVEEEYEEFFLQTSAADAANASGIPRTGAAPSLALPRRQRRAWSRGNRGRRASKVSAVVAVLRLARALGVSRSGLLRAAGSHLDDMQAGMRPRNARSGGQQASFDADAAVALAKRTVALLGAALRRAGRRGAAEAAVGQFPSLLQQAAGHGPSVAHETPLSTRDKEGLRAVAAWAARRRSARAAVNAGLPVGRGSSAENVLLQVGLGGCEAHRDAESCTGAPLGDGTTCSWCTREFADGSLLGRCVLCRGAADESSPAAHGPDKVQWGSSSLTLANDGWTCNPRPQTCDAGKEDERVKAAKQARAEAQSAGSELFPTGLRDDDFPAGHSPPPPDAPNNEMAKIASEAASDAVGAVLVPPLHALTHGMLAASVHSAVARETAARLVTSLALDIGNTAVARDASPRLIRGVTAGLTATLSASLSVDVAGTVAPALAAALTHDPSSDHYCFLCSKAQVYCGLCRQAQEAAAATHSRGWLYGRYYGAVFGSEAVQKAERISSAQVNRLRTAMALGDAA